MKLLQLILTIGIFSTIYSAQEHQETIARNMHLENRCAVDIGSGSMKVEMVEFDTKQNKIHRALCKPFFVQVPLANDFAQFGQLSNQVQQEAIKAWRDILTVCTENKIEKLSGIATAIFRKATDGGPQLFKQLEEIAESALGKDNVSLKIVTQELEGKLGFLTAAALSPEYNQNDIASCDAGNASFQIALENISGGLVFHEGPIGCASTAKLFIESVRNIPYKKGMYVSELTDEERECYINLLKEYVAGSTEFIQNLSPKKVMGVGCKQCMFAIAAAALGKSTYSPEEVYSMALSYSKLPQSSPKIHILDPEEPETVIVRLILLYVIMSQFQIRELTYKQSTGSALGLLLYTDMWPK